MQSQRSLLVVLALLAVTAWLAPSSARADGPRVAVLPFEGAEAISTRIAVHEALGDEGVELVSLAEAGDAARRAHVRGLTRRRVSRAIAFADADAALQGRTEVSDEEIVVRLVLSSGGRVLFDREVPLERVHDAARAIRAALARPAAPAATEEPPRLARPSASSRATDDDAAPWERGETATPSPTTTLPWLTAGIGASARMRDAAFDAADGTRFHRAWYPSIDLAAELRPFHQASGLERGLFVRASFHHAVGLRTLGPNDTVVDTSFWGLAADAGLLVGVARGWDLGFVIGVGVDSFGLADTAETLVPTAVYGALTPGLRLRTQLVDELVVLDVGARYRWVFERGPLGAAFGALGESHGFDLGATLGGSVDVGFSWAVTAELVDVVHQMHGDAALVPASGGHDLGLRFGARVGLALR